ncbi:hypothetical protein MRB53_018732 [Persea americana]|uniref:Uncharacterized protein n=1 Tax=Persea americana TaxID=3435 RepID=A0ACC2M8W1_PERAE|nr:hypothetical protein MRB53_018732 [Persea americana]
MGYDFWFLDMVSRIGLGLTILLQGSDGHTTGISQWQSSWDGFLAESWEACSTKRADAVEDLVAAIEEDLEKFSKRTVKVDLDLGNYERFLDIKLTYAIQEWIERVGVIPVDGKDGPPDVCVIELGGTIGDIESMPFIEALGQFSRRDQKAHEAILKQLNLLGVPKEPILEEWTSRAQLCDMLHDPNCHCWKIYKPSRCLSLFIEGGCSKINYQVKKSSSLQSMLQVN